MPANKLREIIIQRIRDEGPLPFREFMEMSLYYPELGYYTSPGNKIGTRGDYFTNCTITPAFGAVIARELEEMWALLGRKAFTILEYGAGTGALCQSILQAIKCNKNMYDMLRYCIIEKSPVMQEKQRSLLHEKVSWYDRIEDIPDLEGCILSNELVDNFAVHRVIMEQDGLKEIHVDYRDGFTEVLKPAGDALHEYLSMLKVELPAGFKTEINMDADDWMKAIGNALKKGYVMTFDYGYASGELYSEYKNEGTLTCYYQHQRSDNPYVRIGEQDITSSVNFSALCLSGLNNGLGFCGFTDQAHFLNALDFSGCLKKIRPAHADGRYYHHEVMLEYLLLSGTGHAVKLLIQQKNAPSLPLTGLKRP